MNDPTPPEHNDSDAEQLVAYLDGELDAANHRQVELRLASDTEFRLRLQQLQRTWQMLDSLSQVRSSDTLTKTTVEMVVQQVGRRHREIRTASGLRSIGFWVSAGCLALLAGLVGFGITSRLLSLPNRHLVRDLPVIENVDLYHNVGDIEFLNRLDQSGLFVDGIEDLENAY